MVITAATGRMNKIHISIDGEYKYTVDAEYWFSCPWCRKKEISSDEEQQFNFDLGSRYAFISGLRILSYGDNSRKELFRKLKTKGHPDEYIEAALLKLEEYGYINDRRFAEHQAERLIRTKKMSKRGIMSELLQKGINRDIVNSVLEELEVDPIEQITELLEKKYKRYLGDEKGIKKTIAALQRLGYSWSDIKSAMNSVEIEGDYE